MPPKLSISIFNTQTEPLSLRLKPPCSTVASSSKPPGAPPAYLSQQSVALGAQVLERYCQRRYGELYGRNIKRARDEDEDFDADEVYIHGYFEYANKFYKRTGKYIFPLLLLVGYGLLGGAVFQHLESDNEQQLVNARLVKKQLQLNDLTEQLTDMFHEFDKVRLIFTMILLINAE